jgi:hypothetical protein
LMEGLGHRLESGMGFAFIVVVYHILLVLKDRDNCNCVSLRALICECFARLNINDVWLAVLFVQVRRCCRALNTYELTFFASCGIVR